MCQRFLRPFIWKYEYTDVISKPFRDPRHLLQYKYLWSGIHQKNRSSDRRRADQILCQPQSGFPPSTWNHASTEPGSRGSRSPHTSDGNRHLERCVSIRVRRPARTHTLSSAPLPLNFFWRVLQGSCSHPHYEGQRPAQSGAKAPPRDFLSPSRPDLI